MFCIFRDKHNWYTVQNGKIVGYYQKKCLSNNERVGKCETIFTLKEF